MPYTWVENERYLSHKGITVYHVYRNDYANERRAYHFTLDPWGGEEDDGTFDVRELPGAQGYVMESESTKGCFLQEKIEKKELRVCRDGKLVSPWFEAEVRFKKKRVKE